jgi:hypothetical protein
VANALVRDEPLVLRAAKRVRWSYHVSMRLHQRDLTREIFYVATEALIRVVTMYVPNLSEWSSDGRIRRIIR